MTMHFPSSTVHDALIISDLHLGSTICRAEEILQFLQSIDAGVIRTKELVLNGDVFDSMDFRRLRRRHWKILSTLRKLSNTIRIVWVCGNHDGPAEVISHLLGVEVMDEHAIHSGRERMLVLHGHTFDDFIDDHPFITAIADTLYRALQVLDRSHAIARRAKYGSKTFLRCSEKVRDGAAAYARKCGYSAVVCGHTHHPAAERAHGIAYFNSGCWTERPCTLVSVHEGTILLRTIDDLMQGPSSRFESTVKMDMEMAA